MLQLLVSRRPVRQALAIVLCCLVWAAVASADGKADPPAPNPESPPAQLSLSGAVAWALQNNPELAAIRQQRGIAAAAVVIAQTYPFNPVAENRLQANNGPESAGITNRIALEHLLLLEVELRGQGTYRRQVAAAALSRTDWEIAFQEELFAIRVIRAFNTFLYRSEKLKLIEETIQLNQRTVGQIQDLVKAAIVKQPDLIVARTEEVDARSLLAPGRTNLSVAASDLRRSLGLVDAPLKLRGTLEGQAQDWDIEHLTEIALERRPDLRARQSALAEAEADLRLTIADRYGNPTIGPAYTYDPSRVNELGGHLNIPLPVLNSRRGQILQREAERTRAVLEVRQVEITVRQDVYAALDRLHRARAAAGYYRSDALPRLQTDLKEMEALFLHNQAGFLQLIDARRKLLRARDSSLDALLEVAQALADLAAAVGDPTVAFNP